ncbi:MAG: TOBE domain-containing protein [Rhodospirillaceae bacterium]|nr:TOBE domain-containing protein [Rhodospirillaceae bacterium]
MPRITLIPQFTIEDGGISRVGADRITLLEAIRDQRSISAAGRSLGLSYKAAWDGVNALNNLFPAPLVVARPGGRHGGGAILTAEGADIIAAFHLIERELADVMADLQGRLGDKATHHVSRILRSLAMKTSARNALRCVIDKIDVGAVNADVHLHLTDGVKLSAIITNHSVQDMGLVPGGEVLALIKSTFVLLAPAEDVGRISARNKLFGNVITRDDGAVSSEFVLDIGGGKTVSAIVTKESAETLGLSVGDRACALVKAAHVILAIE